MSKTDECCLHEMLDAAQEAVTFLKGRTRTDLQTDRMLALSVIKDIEIMGEAATLVSPATRAFLPQFPWDHVTSIRRKLVQNYSEIDFEMAWITVQQDLPKMIEFVESLIPSDSTGAAGE